MEVSLGSDDGSDDDDDGGGGGGGGGDDDDLDEAPLPKKVSCFFQS